MSFDTPATIASEPVKQKLSRLKRAVPISAPSTAAQQQLPHVSTAPQALVDRTNSNTVRKQAPSTGPQLPPERGFSGAASSPNQPSADPSPNSSPQPAHTSSESQNSQQPAQMESEDAQPDHPPMSPHENDYWDSEDELEAELTRRERAEGFHADSESPSGLPQCACWLAAPHALMSQRHAIWVNGCRRQRCTSTGQ